MTVTPEVATSLWLLKKGARQIACELCQSDRGWTVRLLVDAQIHSTERVPLRESGIALSDKIQRDHEEQGWRPYSVETGQALRGPTLHGVKRLDKHREAICFSAHRFLQALEPYARGYSDVEGRWPNRWFDNLFLQASYKFHRTLHDRMRAAEHLGRIAETLGIGRAGASIDQRIEAEEAHRDAPLFLDLLFYYWRIEADCLANMIPHLYGDAGRRQSIPRDGFRKHVTWFTRRQPGFDPEYSEILQTSLSWFDFLAGRNSAMKGVRDVLAHHRGTHQVTATTWADNRLALLSAALVGDSGILLEDVMPTFRSEMRSYCLYLDDLVRHFVDKVDKEVGHPAMAVVLQKPEMGYHEVGRDKGVWMFPIIHGDLAPASSDPQHQGPPPR